MGMAETFNGALLRAHEKGDAVIDLLSEQVAHLSYLVDDARFRNRHDQYRRIPFRGVADATGLAEIAIDVPQGEGWDLINLATQSATPPSPNTTMGIFVYLNDSGGGADGINLLKVVNYGQRQDTDFQTAETAYGGSRIIIRFEGQPAAQAVSGSLKIEQRTQAFDTKPVFDSRRSTGPRAEPFYQGPYDPHGEDD